MKLLITADLHSTPLDLHLGQRARASGCAMIVIAGDLLDCFRANPTAQAQASGAWLRQLAADLRCFLLYALEELAEDENSKELASDKLTAFAIPNDLDRIAEAIREYRSVDPKEEFERAHVRFDTVAGTVLGLSTTQTSQIIAQMREDPFLKELQPAYAYRGFRVQPYSDRSGRDQYA